MFSKNISLTFITALFLLPGIALGFTGPNAGQNPGSGSGAFSIDSSGNIGFGTSAPSPTSNFDATSTDSGSTSHGHVFVVASTTNPGLGIRNLSSGNMYLWSARNFGPLQLYRESSSLPGLVVMEILPTGHVGIHTRATSTARLFVGGNVRTTGAFIGAISGGVSAANVSSEVFGSLQGNGNFAFPANLGVATSTQDGLPQTLSVYGGGYFSGNVGIGTASPQNKLHVNGTGDVRFQMTNQVTGTGATDGFHMVVDSVGDAFFIQRENKDINIYTDNTPGNGVFIETGGNVGIGTVSPQRNLHISGSSEANIILEDASGATNEKRWRLYTYNNQLRFNAIEDANPFSSESFGYIINRGSGVSISSHSFYTSGTERLRINSSGNVGIATTTPASPLTVAGIIESTTGGFKFPDDTIQTTAGGGGGGAEGWSRTSTNVYLTTSTDSVGIGTASPEGVFHVAAPGSESIRLDRTAGSHNWVMGVNLGTANGRFTLGTSNTGEFVSVLPTSGNVGIATTTPAYKLDVVGTSRFTQPVIVGTPTQTNHAATKNYVDSTVGGGSSSGNFATLSVTGTSTLATTSGRVGIGTASPQASLHVDSNSASPEALRLQGSSGNPYMTFQIDAGEIARITALNSSGNDLAFSANGSEHMRIDGSGNVGIGTVSPFTRTGYSAPWLTISSVAPGINLVDSNSANQNVFLSNSAGRLEIGNSNDDGTSPATYLTVGSTGNVGIGTTNPLGKLHVKNTSIYDGAEANFVADSIALYGSVASQNGNYFGGITWHNDSRRRAGIASVMENADADLVGLAFFTQGTDGVGPMYESVRIAHSGNLGINDTTPSYKLDVTGTGQFTSTVIVGTPTADSHAATKSYVDSTVGGGSSSGNFATLSVTGTSTLATTSGNVGIGTASPGFKLDVSGTARVSTGIILDSANYRQHVLISRSGNGYYLTQSGTSGLIEAYGSTDNFQIFGSNLVVKTSGNVGIGTASPGAKLTAIPPGTIAGTNLANAGLLVGTVSVGIGIDVNEIKNTGGDLFIGTIGAYGIDFGTGGGTGDLYIENGGNVGIGNVTPSYKLDVTGTGQFTSTVVVGTPTAASHAATKSYVDSAAGGGVPSGTDGQTLYNSVGSWVASNNIYVASSTGNVGIGTTSPLELLHVQGTGVDEVTGDPRLVLKIGGVAGAKGGFIGYSNSETLMTIMSNNANSGINFWSHDGSSWAERMRIHTNGNVGIGTVSPGTKLDVNGIITISGGRPITIDPAGTIKIKGSVGGWANFLHFLGSSGTDRGGFGAYGGDDALTYLYAGNSYSSPTMVWRAGNVGINDAIPSYKLDVTGTGQFTSTVVVGTPTAASHAATKSYVDSAAGGGVPSGTDGQTLYNSVGSWVASNNIYVASSTGNVGIGTVSSGVKLEVNGGLHVGSGRNTNALITPSISLHDPDGDNYTYTQLTEDGYSGAHALLWNAYKGDASLPMWSDNMSKYANNVGAYSGGAGMIGYLGNGGQIRFYISPESTGKDAGIVWGEPVMSLLRSGYVGIGTTNPQDKLNVAGSQISVSQNIVSNSYYDWLSIRSNRAINDYGGLNKNYMKAYFVTPGAGTTGEGNNHLLGDLRFAFVDGGDTILHDRVTFRYNGNVGIGDTTPLYKLDVSGTGRFTSTVIVGTPTNASHAATKSYVDSAVTGGTGTASTTAACNADSVCEMVGASLTANIALTTAAANISLAGGDITGVDKLTVTTIDPLYQIGKHKYATYVASIAGGVKEEYIGKGKLGIRELGYRNYEYVIDFNKVERGSDLWVWYKSVDFSKNNVDALITPYGQVANIYYIIKGDNIIFRGDAPAEFSFRLTGKRFDWGNWPTFAKDQSENPSLIVK